MNSRRTLLLSVPREFLEPTAESGNGFVYPGRHDMSSTHDRGLAFADELLKASEQRLRTQC